jgi:hypothetical protein
MFLLALFLFATLVNAVDYDKQLEEEQTVRDISTNISKTKHTIEPILHHNAHGDVRCKCVCPNPSIVNASHTERKLYIKNVPPMLCDCPNVVITSLYETLSLDPAHKVQLPEAFCPRCVCKYEQRNTAVIKFVVLMVMSIIGLLGLYLMFLLLEPKVRHRLHLNYSRQVEEEQMSLRQYDENFCIGPEDDQLHLPDVAVTTRSRDWSGGAGASTRPGTLLHQVTSKQDKWKHQLAVQRRNIYEDRSILN